MITEDEKVTLFDEEFIIKKDTPASDQMSGFHNGKRITVSYDDMFEVLRDIVMYYEDNYMSLQYFIENINIGSKTWVDEDPDNRFVAPLSEDVEYWSAKGITTVVQLRHYLDNEFEFAT